MSDDSPVECPVCLKNDMSMTYRGQFALPNDVFKYALWRCHICGSHWVDPRPSNDVIPLLYSQDYRKAQGTDENSEMAYSNFRLRIARARGSARSWQRQWSAAVEWLSGRVAPLTLTVPLQLSPMVNMLDVGCGAGGWLLAMHRLGYTNLYGQDIDDHGRTRLNAKGIKFFQGDLSECQLSDKWFDLVRLEHVLEHIADPVRFLTRIRGLLKGNGSLVLTVPNIESLSYAWTGVNWHALELPLHLCLYSPLALSYLAERCGFRVVGIRQIPVWHQMTSSLAGKRSQDWVSRILHHKGAKVIAPLWGVLTRGLRRGDFFSAWLQPLENIDC